MTYSEYKQKYVIYSKSLESKKNQLYKKENEIEKTCDEYDSVSSIYVNAKKELEKSKNYLDSYINKKFSISSLKLIGFLTLLSIGAEILMFCSGNNGFAIAVLFTPLICLVDTIIFGTYNFIKLIRPEWIQRFWKKDKRFNELKEYVKSKEKELSIAETNRNIIYDKVNKCRNDIKTLEENISYIENDIKELMLAYAPTLFSEYVGEETDEQDKIQKRPYTRIRR